MPFFLLILWICWISENVQKWVDALRSGEYKQGRGRLKDNNSYCCLGVLCEVFKEEADLEAGEEAFYSKGDEVCFQTSPPFSINKLLGFKQFDGFGQVTNLFISLNDKDGKSFSEIADYIEEHYEELFNNI